MDKKSLIIFSAGTIFLSLVFFFPSALAQSDASIYQLSYSPEESVVFNDVIFSIGAENSGNSPQSYLMELQITKDGKLFDTQKFTFSLEKGKQILLSPRYTPQDIGEYNVIANLYDNFKTNLFDTKIIKFNSVSKLGPFDITIDPLTTRVRPGLPLPTRITLENQGAGGMDTEVRVSVDCPNQIFSQSFTVFVPANNRTEKLVSVQTCEQEGLYDVTASIINFNKTWVSSSSQFFVNSSYIQLKFDTPDIIKLKPGDVYTLPVEVTNAGNQKIHNLQFIVQQLPLEWQKTTPSSIAEVGPNETAVFILNITIPVDAEPASYQPRMMAVSKEVIERKIITLQINSFAALPILSETGVSALTYIITTVAGTIGLLISGNLLRKYIKEKTKKQSAPPERSEILKKLKEKIKSKP